MNNPIWTAWTPSFISFHVECDSGEGIDEHCGASPILQVSVYASLMINLHHEITVPVLLYIYCENLFPNMSIWLALSLVK